MNKDDSNQQAKPTAYIDNPRTRVTEWRFLQKGDSTGCHRHGCDYVVVPLFDGYLEIDTGQGSLDKVELKHGIPYFREAGVEHNVINANDFECAFVEVEFLT